MKKLYKQYKTIQKQMAEAKTALSNIENWNVPELEKIEERSTMNKILQQCEDDLKVVLSKIAEQAGNELSKLCLVDAYAA